MLHSDTTGSGKHLGIGFFTQCQKSVTTAIELFGITVLSKDRFKQSGKGRPACKGSPKVILRAALQILLML